MHGGSHNHKASRVGFQSGPVQTTCTGAGRHDLLQAWAHDDGITLHNVLKAVIFHHLFSHAHNQQHFDVFENFVLPHWQKICFVNLDREIAFLTLMCTEIPFCTENFAALMCRVRLKPYYAGCHPKFLAQSRYYARHFWHNVYFF